MACERNALKVKMAALLSGVAGLASRSAYRAATLTRRLAWTLRPPLLSPGERQETPLDREALPALETRPRPANAFDALPRLERLPVIGPMASPGRPCAICQASPEKGGPWYRLGGQAYCADCAPEAAGRVGARLARPGDVVETRPAINMAALPAGSGRMPPPPTTGGDAPRALLLRVKMVQAQCNKSVDLAGGGQATLKAPGWELHTEDGRPTGLAVTPELVLKEGEARLKANAWRLTHARTGRDLSPVSFSRPGEAALLGQRLAPFDWRRDFTTFSRREIAAVQATIKTFINVVQPADGGDE
jgi:hypothetical protein